MISITVKTIDSASHSVSCLENATLLELKKAIEVSLNVPANNQRLIHAGKLLAPDTENIANLGLSHGKVIHLVTRLAGVTNDQPPQRSPGRPVSRDPRPTPHLTYSIRSITADGNMELSGEHFSQLMRTYLTNNGPTPRTSTSANPPPTGTTVVSPTTSTSAPVQANTTGSTLPVPSEDPTVYVVGNGMSSSLLFNHRSRRRNSTRTSNSNTGNAEVRTANNNVIFTRAVPLARLRGQVRTTTPQLQLARASSLIRSIELLLELPTTAPLDASISLPSISEPSQEILNQFDPERTNYSQSLARIIDQMTNLERRVGDAMRWLTGSIRGEVWCADNVSRTSLQRASLLSANISYRLSQLHLILFPLMANLRFENTQPGSADIVIPPPELPRRLAARASRANPTVGAQEEGTSLLSHVDEIMFQTTFINDPRGATEPSNSTDVNDRADGDGEEGNAMEMAFQSYLNDLAGMPGLTPSGGTQTETRQMSNPSVAHQADTTSNANQGTVNQRSPGVQERYTITMYPEIQLIPIDLQAIANLPSIVRFPGMVVPPSALFGNRSRRTGSATNANVSVTGDNSTPAVGRTGPSASHNARRSDQLSTPSNEQPSSAQPSSATATRNTTLAAGPRRLSGFPTFIADMFRSAFTGSASANDATDTQSHSTSGNVVPSVTTTHVPTMTLNPQSPQQHSTTTPPHRPILNNNNNNNNNNSTTTSTTTTTTANRGPSRHVQSPRSPSTNQERASSMTTARSDTHHGEDLGSVDQFSSVIEHLGTLLSGVLRIVDHSGVDNLRTLADVLLSGPEPSDLERGTTSHLLRRIAQSLTIRDLQRIADRDLAPLQSIQGVINSWIRDDFLRSEPLSEENINQTAEYLAVAFVNSGDMHEMPMRRTPHSTVSTADIYAMTLNVSRDYFKSLVNLVVATHPGPPSTFAPEITIWLRDILEAWRTEFFALFGDDHGEARRVGRHIVARFLTCNSAPLHDLMYEAALHLLSFLSSNILLPDPGTDGAVWAANRTGISETNLQSLSSAPSTSTHSVGATTSDSNIRVRARQESDDPLNARKKRKPTDGETLPEDDPES